MWKVCEVPLLKVHCHVYIFRITLFFCVCLKTNPVSIIIITLFVIAINEGNTNIRKTHTNMLTFDWLLMLKPSCHELFMLFKSVGIKTYVCFINLSSYSSKIWKVISHCFCWSLLTRPETKSKHLILFMYDNMSKIICHLKKKKKKILTH